MKIHSQHTVCFIILVCVYNSVKYCVQAVDFFFFFSFCVSDMTNNKEGHPNILYLLALSNQDLSQAPIQRGAISLL